ncbi:MAG: oxidoreductase [Sphingobacteriaceae bacterium]|nr:MAG: oxidoreductase [Sphingobacteriaceae bacterium]
MKNYYYLVLFILCFCGNIQAQKIQLLQQDTATSIRGLSVVNDQVAWISGSRGHVGISTDGGNTWKWQQVKGFEKSDFRDVEAFSAKEAIIMSSGTPALILKTTDAGESWKVVYWQDDKAWFLDEMTFVNQQHGFVLGDPIAGNFVVLETTNGGESWKLMANLPSAMPDEAAFAASGTGITPIPYSRGFYFVTGGKAARIFTYIKGKFCVEPLPLKQGSPSQGAFSVAAGGSRLVMVGGDYQHPGSRDAVACFYDGIRGKHSSKNIRLSNTQPIGFQSGVIFLGGNIFLSTGTSGTNISHDGGENWQAINSISFNVCQKAKRGNLVLMAGDKGKIAKLINH